MTIHELGAFPVDWEEARRTGEFTKVTDDSSLKVVSGVLCGEGMCHFPASGRS